MALAVAVLLVLVVFVCGHVWILFRLGQFAHSWEPPTLHCIDMPLPGMRALPILLC